SPIVTSTFSCGFINGESASLVLGQQSFTTNLAVQPPTQASQYEPMGIASDGQNLYVCDADNSRVMIFSLESLTSNGVPAVLELGQPSFATSTIAAPSPNSLHY